MTENAGLPRRRVADVPIVRGDVEVPAQGHGIALLVPAVEPATEAFQPLQLVGPLVRAHLASIRDVGAGHVHPGHLRGDEPGLSVVAVVAEAPLHVLHLEPEPGQDGDPVVGLLAVDRRLVSRRAQGLEGEGLVHDLQLLEADHVRGRAPRASGARAPPGHGSSSRSRSRASSLASSPVRGTLSPGEGRGQTSLARLVQTNYSIRGPRGVNRSQGGLPCRLHSSSFSVSPPSWGSACCSSMVAGCWAPGSRTATPGWWSAPRTERSVAVEVDAAHAALSAPQGHPELRLEDCTRWPEKAGCGQECLSQIESSPGGLPGSQHPGRLVSRQELRVLPAPVR